MVDSRVRLLRPSADVCFGRAELCRALIEDVQIRRVSLLFGGRQSGKTTILKSIENRLRYNGSDGQCDIGVYLDFSTLPTATDRIFELLSAAALDTCRNQIDGFPLAQLPSRSRGSAAALEDFEKNIESLIAGAGSNNDIAFIFLLDEIKNALTEQSAFSFQDNVFSALYGGGSTIADNICFIFAGSQDLELFRRAANSPLANRAGSHLVTGLSKEAVAKFLRSCFPRIDTSVVELIVEKTGGHPGLISWLISTLKNKPPVTCQAARDAVAKLDSTFSLLWRAWARQLSREARALQEFLRRESSIDFRTAVRVLLDHKLDRFETSFALDELAYTGVVSKSGDVWRAEVPGYWNYIQMHFDGSERTEEMKEDNLSNNREALRKREASPAVRQPPHDLLSELARLYGRDGILYLRSLSGLDIPIPQHSDPRRIWTHIWQDWNDGANKAFPQLLDAAKRDKPHNAIFLRVNSIASKGVPQSAHADAPSDQSDAGGRFPKHASLANSQPSVSGGQVSALSRQPSTNATHANDSNLTGASGQQPGQPRAPSGQSSVSGTPIGQQSGNALGSQSGANGAQANASSALPGASGQPPGQPSGPPGNALGSQSGASGAQSNASSALPGASGQPPGQPSGPSGQSSVSAAPAGQQPGNALGSQSGASGTQANASSALPGQPSGPSGQSSVSAAPAGQQPGNALGSQSGASGTQANASSALPGASGQPPGQPGGPIGQSSVSGTPRGQQSGPAGVSDDENAPGERWMQKWGIYTIPAGIVASVIGAWLFARVTCNTDTDKSQGVSKIDAGDQAPDSHARNNERAVQESTGAPQVSQVPEDVPLKTGEVDNRAEARKYSITKECEEVFLGAEKLWEWRKKAQRVCLRGKTCGDNSDPRDNIGIALSSQGNNERFAMDFFLESKCRYNIWFYYSADVFEPRPVDVLLNNSLVGVLSTKDRGGYGSNRSKKEEVGTAVFSEGVNSLELVTVDKIPHIRGLRLTTKSAIAGNAKCVCLYWENRKHVPPYCKWANQGSRIRVEDGGEAVSCHVLSTGKLEACVPSRGGGVACERDDAESPVEGRMRNKAGDLVVCSFVDDGEQCTN